MNEIITIQSREISGELVQTVNARELHIFLENRDHFATWVKDRIGQYDFVDGTDFVTYSGSSEKGRPTMEYAISTDQEVAKVIGTGQNRLFAWLRAAEMLMQNNQPYQRFIDSGHFRVVERQHTDPRGESHTYTRTLITGKGLSYIQQRFVESDAA